MLHIVEGTRFVHNCAELSIGQGFCAQKIATYFQRKQMHLIGAVFQF